MARSASVLSPRTRAGRWSDLAQRDGLVAGQRVGRRPVDRVRQRLFVTRVASGLIVAAGLGLLALGAGRMVMASPRFAVAAIDVRGTERLSREQVLAAAAIAPGTHILKVDVEGAIAALEALPEVRRAEVVRALPNRVQITVEERRPFTLVHAGRLHWVDEMGVAMGTETRAVALDYPVISGLTPEDLATGQRGPSERVARGVALIRTLLRASSPLLGQISEIDVSRAEGPVLYMVDGIEVRLGAEDWEARVSRLVGVLAQLAVSGRAVSAIDLRFRDQVVLTPASRS
jgi:cell division protein FtsQ